MAPTATLYATADDNGLTVHKGTPASVKQIAKPDWHDELQEYLNHKSTVKLAGMTRSTASSYCG